MMYAWHEGGGHGGWIAIALIMLTFWSVAAVAIVAMVREVLRGR